MALQAGTTLDHYRVVEHLGSGAMGDVYRADDLRLHRTVALKTVRADAQVNDGTARLLAEARAASALSHPHIAIVYEVGEAALEGQPLAYIAMEYVEGTTLSDLARPLDLDAVLDIFEQIADALAEATRLGVVHRDLKPANVMVAASGRVKVLDFGVAHRRRDGAASPDDSTRTADLTDFGAGFAGTIGYAAPEQLTGREADPRADVYSFGVMLYEAVCGRRPFAGDNAAQVLESMLTEAVPPFDDAVRDPRLPALERFVRRLLSRDPGGRPASADLRSAVASIRAGVRLPGSDERHGAPGVVIAGFANISGTPDDEWLGAGIAETLTADAAQLESVTIVPRERFNQALRTLRQQTGEADAPLYL